MAEDEEIVSMDSDQYAVATDNYKPKEEGRLVLKKGQHVLLVRSYPTSEEFMAYLPGEKGHGLIPESVVRLCGAKDVPKKHRDGFRKLQERLQDAGPFGADAVARDDGRAGGYPSFLNLALQGIDKTSEGIFRVNGQHDRIAQLRVQVNLGRERQVKWEREGFEELCSLVKLYFRSLKSPLIPQHLYQNFVDFDSEATDAIEVMSSYLEQLPPGNWRCSALLFKFLHDVAKLEDVNKMGAHNLGIVFSPIILRKEGNVKADALDALANSAAAGKSVAFVIKHAYSLFEQEPKTFGMASSLPVQRIKSRGKLRRQNSDIPKPTRSDDALLSPTRRTSMQLAGGVPAEEPSGGADAMHVLKLKSQNQELSKTIIRLQRANQELESKMSTAALDATGDVIEMRMKNQELAKQLRQVKKKLKAATASAHAHSAFSSEVPQLRADLEAQRSLQNTLQDQLRRMREELKSTQTALEEAESKLGVKEVQVEQLAERAARATSLETALDDSRKKRKVHRRAARTLAERVASLEAQLSASGKETVDSKQIAELKSQAALVPELQSQVQQLQQELDAQKVKTEKAKAKASTLESQLRSAQRKAERSAEGVQRLTKECDDLHEQLAAHKGRETQWDSEKKALMGRITDANGIIDEMEGQAIAAAQDQKRALKKLMAQINAGKQEVAAVRSQVSALEELREQLQTEKAMHEAKVKAFELEVTYLKRKASTVTASADDAKVAALSTKVEALERENAELRHGSPHSVESSEASDASSSAVTSPRSVASPRQEFRAKVLYDFAGKASKDQMTVSAGVELVVTKESRGWLDAHLADDASSRGFVPANYVQFTTGTLEELQALNRTKRKAGGSLGRSRMG